MAKQGQGVGFSLMLSAILMVMMVQTATAATYYVANNGNNTNPGTLARPWKTIQKAANTLTPGSRVYVRAGVYQERVTVNVSGSLAGGYIQFLNYPNETPILDGTGLSVPASDSGLFLVVDRSYLVIKGFELRNFKTSAGGRVPVAIHIRGNSHHLRIRDNTIHYIQHNGTTANNTDAHGIAVYGDNATQAINNLIIDGNELYALKLGSSEALVINGNVTGFQVTNNRVHDNNNIGIDAIGFEGVSSDPATDQARNGLISGNEVYNINSAGNPAYGSDRSAGGIYVDGGRNITISENVVHHCNIGIELASEHAGRATSATIVRNNFIYLNDVVGISVGGYDRNRGQTVGCSIVNNTLFRNDRLQWGNGELQLQFDTRNLVIKNNIFVTNAQDYAITNTFTENTGNVVDYNLYFAPDGAANAEWQWRKLWYKGFAAYRAATGHDSHSLFVNPLLVNTTLPDLHLKSTSPAIGVGQNTGLAGGVDIDGEVRVQGGIEIGADEVR